MSAYTNLVETKTVSLNSWPAVDRIGFLARYAIWRKFRAAHVPDKKIVLNLELVNSDITDIKVDIGQIATDSDLDTVNSNFNKFGVFVIRMYRGEKHIVVNCGNKPLTDREGFPYGDEYERKIEQRQHEHTDCYTISIDLLDNPSTIGSFGFNTFRHLPSGSFESITFENSSNITCNGLLYNSILRLLCDQGKVYHNNDLCLYKHRNRLYRWDDTIYYPGEHPLGLNVTKENNVDSYSVEYYYDSIEGLIKTNYLLTACTKQNLPYAVDEQTAVTLRRNLGMQYNAYPGFCWDVDDITFFKNYFTFGKETFEEYKEVFNDEYSYESLLQLTSNEIEEPTDYEEPVIDDQEFDDDFNLCDNFNDQSDEFEVGDPCENKAYDRACIREINTAIDKYFTTEVKARAMQPKTLNEDEESNEFKTGEEVLFEFTNRLRTDYPSLQGGKYYRQAESSFEKVADQMEKARSGDTYVNDAWDE